MKQVHIELINRTVLHEALRSHKLTFQHIYDARFQLEFWKTFFFFYIKHVFGFTLACGH